MTRARLAPSTARARSWRGSSPSTAREAQPSGGDGGADAPVPILDRAASDTAVLIFTAGTAGAPKAAVLTHGNLLANLEQVQLHPGRAVHAGDVALGVLPLFHIFGLNVMLGLSLYAGAALVLVERFDPASTLETVRAHGVTLLAGAPPMFAAWAELRGATGDELASVRLAVSGASALPAEVAGAFEARFGVPLWQGYGLTEAAPVVTSAVCPAVHYLGDAVVQVSVDDIDAYERARQEELFQQSVTSHAAQHSIPSIIPPLCSKIETFLSKNR